jgi:predicted SAM-dependent methyltransferase
MLLNLGCGKGKIRGAVNIDINSDVGPDLVHDIRTPLPYDKETVDEVVLYHTIEHIEKSQHDTIFIDIWRVLKPDGLFILTYPEFSTCVNNWLSNDRGMRDFWEATIYGAQRYPSDYHVCAIDTVTLVQRLINMGFSLVKHCSEPAEPYNTILKVKKDILLTYEDVLKVQCLPVST